ncbi:partial Response regulator PleD, partial [Patescibacteria group bacterium]
MTKETILVVEDSKVFSRILSASIKVSTNFDVMIVESYADLVELLENKQQIFFACLLDLNLPDAPNGEVVDYVLSQNIPAIVFTATFDDNLRDNLLSKGIVDYVVKESPANVEYIISLIKQLKRNATIKALVVDDSKTARNYITKLLSIYRFVVFEAENGKQGLDIINHHKDIRLIITDFNMPKMDGIEFTQHIRQLYNKKEVAIIGVSSYGNNMLSARFLKIGGSDFINKPFLEEEFFCRVNQNMELLDHIKDLEYIAVRDYLTGLYNRRHFFNIGEKLFNRSYRSKKDITVALMDIDHFKSVNDNYGHDVGDIVLQKVAEILTENFRAGDLVARLGGEEFCFLLLGVEQKDVLTIFEKIRLKIAESPILLFDKTA